LSKRSKLICKISRAAFRSCLIQSLSLPKKFSEIVIPKGWRFLLFPKFPENRLFKESAFGQQPPTIHKEIILLKYFILNELYLTHRRISFRDNDFCIA
jgi:hypothetical protein